MTKKQKILLVILLVLGIGSIGMIYANRLFKTADFHYQIAVNINAKTQDKSNQLMDKFSALNPARVDRKNNVLYFEKDSIENLNNKAKEFIGDDKETTISTSEIFAKDSSKNILIGVTLNVIAMAITSFAGIFYFTLRYNSKLSRKNYLFIAGLIFSLNAWVALIELGILSIFSIFYQVRSIDLAGIFFGLIFTNILIFLGLAKFKSEQEVRLLAIYRSIGKVSDRYTKLLLLISLIIFLIVAIGFGTGFVLPALFMTVALILALIPLQG